MTTFTVAVAAALVMGMALLMPASAGAEPSDGPWPEPPSCSNDTGTCTSIEDMLAYECFFEPDDSPFSFCDDPFAELMEKDTQSFAVAQPDDPAPTRLAAPTSSRR